MDKDARELFWKLAAWAVVAVLAVSPFVVAHLFGDVPY